MGGGSNLYFYGYGLTNAFQRVIEVSDLKNFFVKGRILSLTNINTIPFVNVYTRPTGSGDAGSFFKSRITYRVAQSNILPSEEMVMFFERDEPGAGLDENVFRNVARKNMVEIARLGAGADTEQVFLISVNTDTGASLNQAEVVYSGAGLTAFGQTNIVELSDYKQDKQVAIIDAIKSETTLQVFNEYNVGFIGTTTSASPVLVYGVSFCVGGGSYVSTHLYNKATSADSTDTPIMSFGLTARDQKVIMFPNPVVFSTGLSCRLVLGNLPSGVTAPGDPSNITIFYRPLSSGGLILTGGSPSPGGTTTGGETEITDPRPPGETTTTDGGTAPAP
jgi:hypothetical protein